MCPDPPPLSNLPSTGQERAAGLTWLFAKGARLTTRQCADLLQQGTTRTYMMLCRISRVVPIYQDEAGTWQVCDSND